MGASEEANPPPL